jgi:hypothetical protein
MFLIDTVTISELWKRERDPAVLSMTTARTIDTAPRG